MILDWYDYIVKVAIFPRAIYRFNGIPVKISTQFLKNMERTILNFIWINKISMIAKKFKTIKDLFLQLPAWTFICTKKAKVIKITWYCYSDTQFNEFNRIDDPEINPLTFGHLNIDKEVKNTEWKKKASPINGAGLLGDMYV